MTIQAFLLGVESEEKFLAQLQECVSFLRMTGKSKFGGNLITPLNKRKENCWAATNLHLVLKAGHQGYFRYFIFCVHNEKDIHLLPLNLLALKIDGAPNT